MNYLRFLKEKARGYPLTKVLRLEIESLVFGLLSYIPTTLGVLVRGFVCKQFFSKCGGFPWIQPRVIFVHTEKISLGKFFGVNSNSYLNGYGGIEIGDHVLLGSNVTISSGIHPIDGCEPPIITRQSIPSKITIENDVWIGSNAIIMPGIHLAKGTVIGANSVVTKNTQPYSVNAGNPAKFIRYRNNV
ncbi:acyltransferase [Polynucleobacter sp. MWH-Hall10]|nr:acyltransferase [Polynucleobacter hallstattensis]MBU3560591.1 acyltransferase [Polynucleobacter hallstattensis]